MKVAPTAALVLLSLVSATSLACARTSPGCKSEVTKPAAAAAPAAQVRVTTIISNKEIAQATPDKPKASSKKAPVAKIAKARSKRSGRRGGRFHYGTYFVPPPPAYAPQSLPELHYPSTYQPELIEEEEDEEEVAVKPPDKPYKKYIYVRDDRLAPKVLEQKKGVTVWRNRY